MNDEQLYRRALVRRFDAMAYDMQRMSENDMGLLSEDFADRFISITDAMLKLAARLKENNLEDKRDGDR
jgi:hypothetical protein